MIHSKLILDIFDLTFDGYESADLVRSQLPFLTEKRFDRTGVGLFINFNHEKEANNYQVQTKKSTDIEKNEGVDERLTGVEITNESLKIMALADIVLTDGIVDYIEILNYNGEDYPIEEPKHYELYQMWLEPPMQRTIIR